MSHIRSKLIKTIKSEGFNVRVTSKNHIQVSKSGKIITVFPSTPGDRRSDRNSLAPLRRAGFKGRVC